MQIKVNGVTISVENAPVTTGNLALDNLEKQSVMLSRESEDITKMIKLYDIMSNVKAVESFGYRSTEGVGEKLANAAKAVKNKLLEWFRSLIEWVRNIHANFILKMNKGNGLNDQFKPLLDKFNEISKENIKKLSKIDISPEEIQDCKYTMKVCNIVRNATLQIIRQTTVRVVSFSTGYTMNIVEAYAVFVKEIKLPDGLTFDLKAVSLRSLKEALEKYIDGLATFIAYCKSAVNTGMKNNNGKSVDEIQKSIDNFVEKLSNIQETVKDKAKGAVIFNPKNFGSK